MTYSIKDGYILASSSMQVPLTENDENQLSVLFNLKSFGESLDRDRYLESSMTKNNKPCMSLNAIEQEMLSGLHDYYQNYKLFSSEMDALDISGAPEYSLIKENNSPIIDNYVLFKSNYELFAENAVNEISKLNISNDAKNEIFDSYQNSFRQTTEVANAFFNEMPSCVDVFNTKIMNDFVGFQKKSTINEFNLLDKPFNIINNSPTINSENELDI